MYIIVAGPRDLTDYDYVKNCLDAVIKSETLNPEQDKIVIVSGGAKGVDQLGERYAKENDYRLKIMKANWDKHGKSAGYKRNVDMARVGDLLVALWDGKSKGTGHMIKIAGDRDLRSIVFLKVEE